MKGTAGGKLSRGESVYYIAVGVTILGLMAALLILAANKDSIWAFPTWWLLFALSALGPVGIAILFIRRRWPPSFALILCILLCGYAAFLAVLNWVRVSH